MTRLAMPAKAILWWLLAALVAAALCLLAYGLWADRTARLTYAADSTANAARFLGGHVTRTLQSTDAVVRRIVSVMEAADDAAWRQDRKIWLEMRALVGTLPGTESLWVLDADGRVAMISAQFPAPDVVAADREYFLAHKNGAELFVGPTVRGRITKGTFFTVSRTLRDASGGFRGVAAVAVDADAFVDFQRHHGLGPSSAFMVARDDGAILLRSPTLQEVNHLGVEELVGWAAQKPVDTRIAVSPVDGRRRIVSYRSVPDWPVLVTVAASVDDVLAPWWQGLYRSAAGGTVLVAFFALAAAMAWRSGRSEEAAVEALKTSHEELEQKVAERTAALEAQRTSAQDSVEQLRFALAAAQAGTWDWDVASGRIAWSEGSYRLFGLEPGSGEADLATWVRLLDPEDRSLAEDLLRLTVATRAPTYRAEYRVRRPDGSTRWIAGIGRAFYAPDGTPLRVTGVNFDVTSIKQAEAAMRDAKLEAERANVAKSKFLASASHDLRQPFQAMRLFYEVLFGLLGDPRARAVAEKLNEAMRAGEELLGALLDVSTLDAGIVRLNLAPFSVAEVLERVVAECEPQAQAKGLRLRYVPTAAVVVSDRVLLARMVRNLVVNAIRYTSAGSVLVGCRPWGGAVRLEVWDTGIGIPDDKQQLIFEDFFQLDNEARDKSKGLGLGLSVVARMSRLLGHPIELHSRPNKGSVFALVLPKAAAADGQPTRMAVM